MKTRTLTLAAFAATLTASVALAQSGNPTTQQRPTPNIPGQDRSALPSTQTETPPAEPGGGFSGSSGVVRGQGPVGADPLSRNPSTMNRPTPNIPGSDNAGVPRTQSEYPPAEGPTTLPPGRQGGIDRVGPGSNNPSATNRPTPGAPYGAGNSGLPRTQTQYPKEAVPSPSAGSGSQGMIPNPRATGSATTGGGRVLMTVDQPSGSGRMDRGQNRLELMQTSLLNNLSALGFTAVRDFRKEGQRYFADVQSQNGGWQTVELDPNNGTISTVR